MGGLLAGKPVEFEFVDEYAWLREFSKTPEDAAATVLVLSGMLQYLSGKPNDHKSRILDGYKQQFSRLHSQTLARLLGVLKEVCITGFYAGDVTDHVASFADVPNTVFCLFAPTYAGGYEKLWGAFGEIVVWNEPRYETMDDQRRNDLLEWLLNRDFVWIDDRRLGFEPAFAARTGRLRTQYVYSNVFDECGHAPRVMNIEDPGFEIVGEIREDSLLTVVPVAQSVLQFYVQNYLSKTIDPVSGRWAFLVLVDGRVAGALNFSSDRYAGGADGVYLLSDFAVWPTRYERLSKLVVMAACSVEVREFIERSREMRVRRFVTTAFTDKPVSMKYRGLLELLKRGEGFLQYGAEFTCSGLQEIFSGWWSKYGMRLRD
jgi:hypothetical protein